MNVKGREAETTPQPPVRQQRGQLLYLVKTAALAIQQFAEPTLSSLGITVTQYEILALVRSNSGISIAGLARHLGTSRQSTGEQVRMLEAKAFLNAAPNGVGPRGISLFLTDGGTAMLNQADLLVEAAERQVTAGMDDATRAALRGGMRQLIAACREAAKTTVRSGRGSSAA